MQVKVMVIGEQREVFQWKRGKGVHDILLCSDCDTDTPLQRIFDYIMTPDEAAEYSGRLQDKIVMLGIAEIEPTFGGRVRAKGKMKVLSPLKPRGEKDA
jgi:hypothetical protein